MTTIQLLWLLFFFELPAVILVLSIRWRAVDRVSALLLCYLSGLILGLTGIIPPDILQIQHQAAVGTFYIALSLLIITFKGNLRRAETRPFPPALVILTAAAVLLSAGALWLMTRDLLGSEAASLGSALVGTLFGGGVQILTIGRDSSLSALGTVTSVTIERLLYGSFLLLILILVPRLVRNHAMTDQHSAAPAVPADKRKSPGKSGNPARRAANRTKNVRLNPDRQWDDLSFRGFKKDDLLGTVLVLSLAALITFAALVANAIVTGPLGSLLAIAIVVVVSGVVSIPQRICKSPYIYPLGYFFLLVHTLILTSLVDLAVLSGSGWILLGGLLLLTLLAAVAGLAIASALKIPMPTRMVFAALIVLSPPAVPIYHRIVNDRDVVRYAMVISLAGWVLAEVVGLGFSLLLGAA